MKSKEALTAYVRDYCETHAPTFKGMVETAFVPLVKKNWYHRTYDPSVSSVMNHQVDLALQAESLRFTNYMRMDPVIAEECYMSMGFSYTPTEATLYIRFRSKLHLCILHEYRLDTPHVFTAEEKHHE